MNLRRRWLGHRGPRFGTAQKTATAAPKLPKGCPRGPGFATNRTASALFFPNRCRRVLAREVLVAAPCSPFGAERPKVGNRTAAGGGLRLPGLSATITPRPRTWIVRLRSYCPQDPADLRARRSRRTPLDRAPVQFERGLRSLGSARLPPCLEENQRDTRAFGDRCRQAAIALTQIASWVELRTYVPPRKETEGLKSSPTNATASGWPHTTAPSIAAAISPVRFTESGNVPPSGRVSLNAQS
jgi:hypothetical protein